MHRVLADRSPKKTSMSMHTMRTTKFQNREKTFLNLNIAITIRTMKKKKKKMSKNPIKMNMIRIIRRITVMRMK